MGNTQKSELLEYDNIDHYSNDDFERIDLCYFEEKEDENFTRWRLFTCFLLDNDEYGVIA